MKLVINTSFNPHFCALYETNNQLVEAVNWEIPKEDGQRVWDFLKTHLTADTNLSFIGGVSGPGSFSSLRAGGAILNALAFKYELPIFQVRADKVIIDFLKTTSEANHPFLLNSFGSRVFVCENETIIPCELNSDFVNKSQPTITSWLPSEKAAVFAQPIAVNPLGPLETILATLEKTTSQTHFIPDYEYPAVQVSGVT